jgi:cytochrome b561
MTTTSPQRYSPLWVTIHWLVALLIFAAIYLGISSFQSPPEAKAAYLRWHMPIGVTVLVLMLVRLYLRWRAPRPADATAGNALFDFIGRWTHYLLYAFALLVPLSGFALSIRYNLPPIVFGGQGAIPADLTPALHGLLFPLFTLLILLHILAALYHQFIRKDNLLARMWYGK